jgi:hypothetical protein
LRAVNGGGQSANSTTKTALTIPANPVLDTPDELDVTSNSIALSWTAVTGATEYLLELSINNFNDLVGTYPPINGITYTITSLSANTAFQIRLRSKNDSGPSGYSNVLAVTTRDPSTDKPLAMEISYSETQNNTVTQPVTISVTGGALPYKVEFSHRKTSIPDYTKMPPLVETDPGKYEVNFTGEMLDAIGGDFIAEVTDGDALKKSANGHIAVSFNDAQSPLIPFANFGGHR